MSKIEVDDTSSVHLGDRSLEFYQEIRRESPSQRAREQNAWSVLEDEGDRVDLAKKARDRLDAFETLICPSLATQEPGTEQSAHKTCPRRKIFDHDRSGFRLDEQNVRIAPTPSIQDSACAFCQVASVEPDGIGKDRNQRNTPP